MCPTIRSKVRDHRASFKQSIEILKHAKLIRPDIITKTSLMVGVGETDEQISESFKLIRAANVLSNHWTIFSAIRKTSED